MSVTGMLKGLVRLAVVSSFSSDDKVFPIHKIEYMGKVADAVAWYPFGFHANPGPDALSIFFAIGGNSESRIFFPGSPEDRIDDLLPTPLAENEVLLYHPPTKSYIHFKEDGTIDINSQKDVNITGADNVTVTADNVTITAATLLKLISTLIECDDGGTALSLFTDAFVSKYNAHIHPGGGAPNPPSVSAVIGTDTTTVLKAE